MQSSFCTLFLCLFFGQLTPLVAQWQPLQGPYGGLTTNLLANSQYIYLNTSNGIYRSANEGVSWQKPAYNQQSLYDMQLLGINEEQLLAYSVETSTFQTNKWLHISTDNGDSWSTIALPDTFPIAPVASILGQHIILGDYRHIWESGDGGQTWIYSPLDADVKYVGCILLDHQRFYVSGSKLAVSEPGGQNFTLKNLSGHGYVSNLTVVDSFIFAYDPTEQRYYRSSLNDSIWIGCNPDQLGNSPHQIASLNDTLYTLNRGILAYSIDNGLNWTNLSGVPQPYQYYQYVAVHGSTVFVGGYYTSLLRAPGIQGPWQKSDYGVANSSITDLAFSDNYLFAGANNVGLFRYGLNNATWDSLNLWETTRQFTDVWTHDGLLYATRDWISFNSHNSIPLEVSADEGLTWTELAQHLPVNRITGNEQSLYVWNDGDLPPTSAAEHYKSDDDGATWESLDVVIASQIPFLSLGDLAVRGNDVWITTQHGIVHSADNGATWTEQTNGLLIPGNSYTDISRVFVVDSLLFASGRYLFYCSKDNGQSWQPANSGLSLRYATSPLVNAVVRFNGKPVAISRYGLYISQDEGLHWAIYPAELPDKGIQSMAVHDSLLYVGTIGRGVWVNSMAGFAMERVSGHAYWDDNNNGIEDAGEIGAPGLVLQLDAYNQVATRIAWVIMKFMLRPIAAIILLLQLITICLVQI